MNCPHDEDRVANILCITCGLYFCGGCIVDHTFDSHPEIEKAYAEWRRDRGLPEEF